MKMRLLRSEPRHTSVLEGREGTGWDNGKMSGLLLFHATSFHFHLYPAFPFQLLAIVHGNLNRIVVYGASYRMEGLFFSFLRRYLM
ncbi:hypothetical protein SLEP1_g21868 [Rubroshorea leprosula]|uniref:Uncharacterized protein n=1 Tax=Rubroshorea leprosula TaxID=152421 RepID=A0AAV5JGN9_9ROSI|nr:hypothetical protein SLEP1_g21868 [Rubroshorea leprosula]